MDEVNAPHPTDPPKLPAPLAATSTPMDVARCKELADSIRRRILDQWHEDAIAVERAASEGMSGEGRSRLAEVTAALQALDELCESERPRKSG
jgi:hypothetical protein